VNWGRVDPTPANSNTVLMPSPLSLTVGSLHVSIVPNGAGVRY